MQMLWNIIPTCIQLPTVLYSINCGVDKNIAYFLLNVGLYCCLLVKVYI